MAQFPTAAHLVSWAKLSPRTIQSGPRSRSGKTGKGNRYLKGVLGEAATGAAKTNTCLGERYRSLVRRRGKQRALVAVARSIHVITWYLLAGPTARYDDLGSDFYDQHFHKDRKTRNLICQLQALGHQSPSPARPDRPRDCVPSGAPVRTTNQRAQAPRHVQGHFPAQKTRRGRGA
jgi:transposase